MTVDTIVGWSLTGWSLNPHLRFSLDFRDFRRKPPRGQSLPGARLLFHDPQLVDLASIRRGVMEGLAVEGATLVSSESGSVDCTLRTSRGGAIHVVARSHSLLLSGLSP